MDSEHSYAPAPSPPILGERGVFWVVSLVTSFSSTLLMWYPASSLRAQPEALPSASVLAAARPVRLGRCGLPDDKSRLLCALIPTEPEEVHRVVTRQDVPAHLFNVVARRRVREGSSFPAHKE